MSAIYGIFHWDEKPAEARYLRDMEEVCRAYGTDGGGVWMRESVGLGVQLAHATPEDLFERQPLVCPDSGRVLVADVRLDNRPELAEALAIADAGEVPDSEFILRAYEKWGVECVVHLLGNWAFALWDAPQKRLVLACDRMGGRSLFWHRNAQRLAFATSTRALLALPDVERQLNREKIAGLVSGHSTLENATFYRDIFEFPLAHRMIVTRQNVSIERYWQPDYAKTIRLKRDEDYVEAFVELFERVMRDSLRAITPVSVMMSGGLDSASIGATAARLLAPQRVTAFTEVPRAGFEGAVMPNRYADETPYVEMIAALYPNLDVQWVRQGEKNLLHDDEGYLEYSEGPFGIAANRVWWEEILRQSSARGCKTVLDGMQGNVAFSWNGSGLLAELIRGGKWRAARREAALAVKSGEQNAVWRAIIRQGIVPMLPAPVRHRFGSWRFSHAEAQVKGVQPLVHPDFAREFDMETRLRESHRKIVRVTGVQTPEIRWGYFLKGNGFGASNAAHAARFGVDVRRPLCDVRLVEWCLAIPETQCRREGQPRFLVRRAMADRLPPEIVENRQRGLQAADWLEHLLSARPAIEAEIGRIENSPTARSVLDVAQLRRIVKEWPADLRPETYRHMELFRITLAQGVMLGRYLRSFD